MTSPLAAASLLVLSLVAAPAAAGSWPPEEITNLQILPEDTEFRALMDVMKGFTRGLGVRCSHCHVYEGDAEGDLSTFDFADDAKESKRKARVMYRMVQAINREHLAPLGGDPAPTISCETCHHGQPVPTSLERELSAALGEGGAAAAVARHRELRAEHFGGWAYDFGPDPLFRLGSELAAAERLADALLLLELNLESHPEDEKTLRMQGEVLAAMDRTDEAIAVFEALLRMRPDSGWVASRLEALRSPQDGD